jgi:hypothetical protein
MGASFLLRSQAGDGVATGYAMRRKDKAMQPNHEDRLLKEAVLAVERYVAIHPGYTIDAEQPEFRGGTNRVILGLRNGQPIVFKYFVTTDRWLTEYACLRHFQPAGIVPQVIDAVPERLIVMERIEGSDGLGGVEEGTLSAAQVQDLGRQVGRALGKITATPLPTTADGYSPVRDFTGLRWSVRLDEVVHWYVASGRRVQKAIPAYAAPLCDGSLALLASQAERLAHDRQILFHEDIWNLRVDGDRFLAFYDLEMCRVGTEAMQLGVAVELCGPGRLDWGDLQHGFEAEVGRALSENDLLAVLAMNHFYHWIRACRWGHWDGDPADTEHLRSTTTDAEHHIARMIAACRVLGEHVNVMPWFGSL